MSKFFALSLLCFELVACPKYNQEDPGCVRVLAPLGVPCPRGSHLDLQSPPTCNCNYVEVKE